MRNKSKDLIEMCEIEIAYARADILACGRLGPEKGRIVKHLNSALNHLTSLMVVAGEAEADPAVVGQREERIA